MVRERRPVGYVALDDGVGLVGSDGSVYRRTVEPPNDLPAFLMLRWRRRRPLRVAA